MKPAMSNQGCYNGFLAVALALGFLLPDAATGRAFTIYGLACVAVAGVWGAMTVQIRILFVQTVPIERMGHSEGIAVAVIQVSTEESI